jgi:hypothetical protein
MAKNIKYFALIQGNEGVVTRCKVISVPQVVLDDTGDPYEYIKENHLLSLGDDEGYTLMTIGEVKQLQDHLTTALRDMK